MRAYRMFYPAAALALAWVACTSPTPTFSDGCEEARWRIESCGVTAPVLEDEPCTGLARAVSQCVNEHTYDCDTLAALMRQPDVCLADAGEVLLEPVEDLPVPPPEDGGVDAGPGSDTLVYERRTVAAGEAHTFTSRKTAAGVYLVTLRGTGNADLFVRRNQPASITTFDCAPRDETTNEACTTTLSQPGEVHVRVEGVAAESVYTLQVTEG